MIWLLLVLFQLKHFVCDYPLQGRYMLGKFKPYPDFILPLGLHALVHVAGTFIISVFLVSPLTALLLGLLDGVIHFAVDRVKASPTLLGRFKALSANEMRSILKVQSEKEESRGVILTGGMNMNDALKSNTFFWWALGVDQMAHHLTHYLIIALIMGGL